MSTSIINPLAPQAYLSPDLAPGYDGQSHMYFLTLGAWLWDFLNALPEEYTTVWRRKPSVSSVFYILARIMTLVAIVSSIVFQLSPTTHCGALMFVICIAIAGASVSAAFMFLIRVTAIYNRSWVVAAWFGVLWALLLGTTIAMPFFITTGHIGATTFCIITAVKPLGGGFTFSPIPFAVLTVYDTLIFVFISWRLNGVVWNHSISSTWTSRLLSLFRGRGLPHFTKSVLRHGQKYYLATAILNVTCLIMLLTSAVPSVLHAIFIVPAVAMQNALACRIYRETLLDLSSVHTQRIDLGRQSPLQIRHDIHLSDMLSKNGLGTPGSVISRTSSCD
ncbi:hypothetical protein BXZ70DRAFT_349768 [Cristinia sonorae]|uniref:DUF6533 domain-containing protein n=1 Tax=Cristinia sonorae TaxID=1940300 RepID=A0A8K0UJ52_9AGAR|nr:hypothetical protein BXZ70DRAFT_349768 [Cristinia sonorae]